MHPTNDPDFHVALHNLIAQGNTAEAIGLLHKAGYDEASALKEQWEAATLQWEAGRIGFEEWSRLQNRLHYAMLHGFKDAIHDQNNSFLTRLDALNELRQGQPFGPVPHARVKAYLDENKTAEAIELCRALGTDYIHLLARYNSLQKNTKLGRVSDAEAKRAQAMIHGAVQMLLLEVPDSGLA